MIKVINSVCFLDQYSIIKYAFLFIISNINHQIVKLQPFRNLREVNMENMPLFKHLWVAKELLHLCAKFQNNPREENVLLTSKVGILKKCCEIQVIQNVRNKNGCVMSRTEKVDLS